MKLWESGAAGGFGDILFCSKQGPKLNFTFSFTPLFMTCLASAWAELDSRPCCKGFVVHPLGSLFDCLNRERHTLLHHVKLSGHEQIASGGQLQHVEAGSGAIKL